MTKLCPYMNNCNTTVLTICLHAHLSSTPLVLNWIMKTERDPLRKLTIRKIIENTDSYRWLSKKKKGYQGKESFSKIVFLRKLLLQNCNSVK